MRKRLGVSTGEFLDRFTLTVIPEASGFPLAVLKMADEPGKPCPFVSPSGCTIYEDRPWSCRMFPLERGEGDAFRVIAPPEKCLGLGEEGRGTVEDYLRDQEVAQHEEMEGSLQRLSRDSRLSREKIENPKVREMCRMAMYDLDRFRRFVLESRFLEIFEVDRETASRIREDDLELMRLAHRWLEFGLVSGEGMRIREDVIQGKATYRTGAGDTGKSGGQSHGS
jgi:Fe-S-cluster containining protein